MNQTNINSVRSRWLVALVVAVVLAVAGIVWQAGRTPASETTSSTETTESVTAAINVSEDGKTVSYEGRQGQTALALLKTGAEVATSDSDFGEFVTAINGVEAEASQEYWAFYVNGNLANEGAGTYQTQTGDRIEWRLENL